MNEALKNSSGPAVNVGISLGPGGCCRLTNRLPELLHNAPVAEHN